MKDWHLKNICLGKDPPHGSDFYSTPIYFQSDFLNEYSEFNDSTEDDYKFVYIGTNNTNTPLHKDVLNSFSWSVNIFGLKKWIFLKEGSERNLLEKYKLKEEGDFYPRDVTKFFEVDEKLKNSVTTFYQKENNAIFVPSATFHQVENVAVRNENSGTASINHNWINSCNLLKVWDHLQEELILVEKSIEEFRDSMEDFESHCQMMLKSCTGMNFESFRNMLLFVLDRRKGDQFKCDFEDSSEVLALLDDFSTNCTNDRDELDIEIKNFSPSSKLHATFDVLKISEVLRLVEKSKMF